jgi:hypothetical protein
MNCLNKSSHGKIIYEFFNSLPDGAIDFQPWTGVNLRDKYYKSGNDIFVHNSVSYRKLYKNKKGYVRLAIKTESGRTKYRLFRLKT